MNNKLESLQLSITNAHDYEYLSEEKKKEIEEKSKKMDAIINKHLYQNASEDLAKADWKYKDLSKLSEEEKDKVYSEIHDEWNDYQEYLRSLRFNTNWSVDEYRFLRKYILHDAELDQTSIFMAFKIEEEFFKKYGDYGIEKEGGKKGDKEPFMVTIDEITTIYSLISEMKVKGGIRDKKSLFFASILSKIGSMNKVFNEYIEKSKIMSRDIQKIASNMEDVLSSEQLEEMESEKKTLEGNLDTGDEPKKATTKKKPVKKTAAKKSSTKKEEVKGE